jgi:hypothetical protein
MLSILYLVKVMEERGNLLLYQTFLCITNKSRFEDRFNSQFQLYYYTSFFQYEYVLLFSYGHTPIKLM